MLSLKTRGRSARKKDNVFTLSPAFVSFVKMGAFFNVGMNLSTIFVSTFLLKADGDFYTVAFYYMLVYLAEVVGVFFSTNFSRKISPVALTRIGLILYTASYAVLLLGRERSTTLFPIIGILNGAGAAFYWTPFHNYTQMYSTQQNIQYGMSINGIVGNVISLITPSISGFIISCFPDITGYIIIFVMTIVTTVCAALITRRMPSQPQDHGENPLLGLFFKVLPKSRAMKNMVLQEIFRGARDGVFFYYLNVLIFSMTSNELVTGLSASARALMGIATFFVIRKCSSNSAKVRMYMVGTIGFFLATTVLFGIYNITAVVLYYIFLIIFSTLDTNGDTCVTFMIAESISTSSRSRRLETIAFRNCLFNFGRAISLVIYVLIPPDEKYIVPMLFFFATIGLPSCFFARRAAKYALENTAGN